MKCANPRCNKKVPPNKKGMGPPKKYCTRRCAMSAATYRFQAKRSGFSVASLRDIKCRFGCDAPVVIVHVPEGCMCWHDPIQALCDQHLVKLETIGPVTTIVDLRPPSERKSR